MSKRLRPLHITIAEDTPELLTGPGHNQILTADAIGVVTSQEKKIKFFDVEKAEYSKKGEIKVIYKEHALERAGRQETMNI